MLPPLFELGELLTALLHNWQGPVDGKVIGPFDARDVVFTEGLFLCAPRPEAFAELG
jgi:hypothetical protein